MKTDEQIQLSAALPYTNERRWDGLTTREQSLVYQLRYSPTTVTEAEMVELRELAARVGTT